MRTLVFTVSLSLTFCLLGCRQASENMTVTLEGAKIGEKHIKYAKRFTISEENGLKRLQVFSGTGEVFCYNLVKTQDMTAENTLAGDIIEIPVKKAVCLSSTHIAFIDGLGESSTIVGVDNRDRIFCPQIHEKVQKNMLAEVGNESELNIERILEIKPDIVFVYWIDPVVSAQIDILKKAGIPVVQVLEYREETPLGKAEWIRFFGAFFNKDSLADEIFKTISQQYNILVNEVKDLSEKPKVIVNLPWKDVWYIPSQHSFAAHFIRDAGGIPCWNIEGSEEFYAFDPEYVLERWSDADIWINPGAANTLSDMKASSHFVQAFQAFVGGRVFNNNNRLSPKDANDYWESGTLQPHIVLKDLIRIFHPEKLPEHQLYYYKKVEK